MYQVPQNVYTIVYFNPILGICAVEIVINYTKICIKGQLTILEMPTIKHKRKT